MKKITKKKQEYKEKIKTKASKQQLENLKTVLKTNATIQTKKK